MQTIVKEVLILHCLGIILTLLGTFLSLYTSIPKIHIIKKDTLDLNEKRQADEFEAPIESILKIKLNGKRKQKMRFALYKTKKSPGLTQNWKTTSLTRDIKGNSKLKFNLQRDDSYSFIVQPEINELPFVPFIVEYSIFECNNHSDRLFQFGLTLITAGLVIYFAT